MEEEVLTSYTKSLPFPLHGFTVFMEEQINNGLITDIWSWGTKIFEPLYNQTHWKGTKVQYLVSVLPKISNLHDTICYTTYHAFAFLVFLNFLPLPRGTSFIDLPCNIFCRATESRFYNLLRYKRARLSSFPVQKCIKI